MKLLHAAVALASTMLCVLGQGTPRPLQDPAPLDPAAAGPAMRIWSHRELGMQEVWFRREFDLEAVPDEATFVFSCDNEATVFVNGKRVAHSEHWEELTVVDVTRLLVKGKNVVAIHAKNTGSCAALAAWRVRGRIVRTARREEQQAGGATPEGPRHGRASPSSTSARSRRSSR